VRYLRAPVAVCSAIPVRGSGAVGEAVREALPATSVCGSFAANGLGGVRTRGADADRLAGGTALATGLATGLDVALALAFRGEGTDFAVATGRPGGSVMPGCPGSRGGAWRGRAGRGR